MGPATRTSIRSFRVDKGLALPPSETLDAQLLNALGVMAR